VPALRRIRDTLGGFVRPSLDARLLGAAEDDDDHRGDGDAREPWELTCGGGVRLHLRAQLGESRSAVNCSMSGTPEVSAKAIRSSRETSRWNEAQDGQRRSVHRTRTTGDRKSTRLNSSHVSISYAVFCLKKKERDHRRT